MGQNNKIHEDAIVLNSILENKIRAYKGAVIKDSNLESDVSIGNDSVIEKSAIRQNTAINRRNYILKSEIGRFSYTGIGTLILSSKVGSFCSISWNVSIGGAEHKHNNLSTLPQWRFELMDRGSYDKQEIKDDSLCEIGNDVLISSNAIILRNIKIGDGAVIGAGAVVTKDVEPYSIVAGVPARKINMRFKDEIVKTLLEIKWWNWPIKLIRENQELLFSTEIDEKSIERIEKIASTI